MQRTHPSVLIGCSMLIGGLRVLLTTLTPQLNIESVVLLDGTIASKSPERDHMDMILAQLVWPKPDVWRSRKDALRWHSSTPGFKNWDKAVLELFIVSRPSVCAPLSDLTKDHHRNTA